MKRLAGHLSAVALAAYAAGCATVSGIRSEPLQAGIVQEYPASYARVLTAARDAVTNAGLAIDTFAEPNETTAVIVAKKGISGFSWGELVRVVVEQTSAERTVVRIRTQRRLATNVTAKGDYSDTIFSNIALALR